MGPRKKEQEGEQLELFLVADRAYEGDETRQLAVALGYTPVIPPRSNRRHPWDYNRPIYKRRNEVDGSSDGSKATGVSSPATTNST